MEPGSVGGLLRASQPTPAADVANIDFRVLAPDGRPVVDLKADEITLKVGGRVREIRALELVRSPDERPSSDPAAGLPPPFGTNAMGGDGHALLFVLADESIRPGREQSFRDASSQIMASLSGRDRVALATVPHGGIKLDFTTNHGEVRRAVAKLAGQAPRQTVASEEACRTRFTLEALRDLFDSLGGQAPVGVVYLSSGLLGPRRDAPVSPVTGGISRFPGQCEVRTTDFTDVAAAAFAARANVYVVQFEDVMVQPGVIEPGAIAEGQFGGGDSLTGGLEHLAGVTGGELLRAGGTGEEAMKRLAREMSAHYVASIDAAPFGRRPTTQKLEVQVARADVVVRARPEIRIVRGSGRGARRPTTSPRDMLRAPRAFRELPLRAAGYASRDRGDRLKIVVVAEPVDPSAELTAAMAGLFDTTGRLIAQWTANAEELASSPLIAGLVALPGTYRLRVAATDRDGRSGAADYTLVAELTPAGPLTLSALVIGTSGDRTFTPQLRYWFEPAAVAFLEVYGRPGSTPVTATLELASTLNGPAIVTLPATIGRTSDSDRYTVSGAVPIGQLPAGDYVIRAIVAMEGQPAGRVIRTMRKEAP
jgi:hypothetical protein